MATNRRRARAWRVILLAVLAWTGVTGPAALGQTGGAGGPGGEAAGPASEGEIKIEAERFGVGDVVRAGDWVGVRLRLMDSGLKPRDIIVQIPAVDPDGDQMLVRREITSNPGTWYGVWLYFRMPHAGGATSFEVRAYEALEGAREDESGARFRTGRLLGRGFVAPRGTTSMDPPDQIGVIGTKMYGLGAYQTPVSGSGSAPQGHEMVRIVTGLQPEDAPDRWMGWSPFSVLVWGAGEPGRLRGERARALREWIERGGHLVVLLPGYGETWTNAAANELHDLLPAVKLSRKEGVDLGPYAPLLTRSRARLLPKDAVVHELTPIEGAPAAEAVRIFNGPDGATVVARRLVGMGAVDLVGLDLNTRAFADQDVLDADVFWSRLLGRRGEIRTAQEMGQLIAANSLNSSNSLGADYESDIPRLIAKTGSARSAVGLAVVVFILYWIIAGHGGFALLKLRGLQRHAWVAYAAAAAGFTLIAWGGATALRPAKVEADHLTFIDHVFGQPVQRARTWTSLLIPWYGEARIAVGTEEDPGSPGRVRFVNTIVPWAPRDVDAAGRGSFPDARGYEVDVRAPWTMTAPTRSTVKQLLIDWAGTPRWKMPVPVGDGTLGTIRREAGDRLSGVLKHDLPGPLHHVVVIDVPGQQSLGFRPGSPLSRARAYKLVGAYASWEPGQELSLAEVTARAMAPENLAENYLRDLAAGAKRLTDLVPTGDRRDVVDASQRFAALSLYSQLRPPDLTNVREDLVRVRRFETHGWDLGRWFSQPCVIIIGELGDTEGGLESPTPLQVNGEAVKTKGRTVVRWVYPMPDDPPPYPAREAEEKTGMPIDTAPAGAAGEK